MTYAGLCIDGPMDGQRAVAQVDRIEFNIRPEETTFSPQDDFPVQSMVDYETGWYVWHKPGLWLLEGVGPEAARIHMAEAIGTEALASRYEQVIARRKEDG